MAGCSALPDTLAGTEKRDSATAQTYRPSDGCAHLAASPSRTPKFIRQSIKSVSQKKSSEIVFD